jgi:hypothetical protein
VKNFFFKAIRFLIKIPSKTKIFRRTNRKIIAISRWKTSGLSSFSAKIGKSHTKVKKPENTNTINAVNLQSARATEMASNNKPESSGSTPMEATSQTIKRKMHQREAKDNVQYVDGFRRPSPRNTVRRQNIRSSSQPEVPTSNNFATLSDEENAPASKAPKLTATVKVATEPAARKRVMPLRIDGSAPQITIENAIKSLSLSQHPTLRRARQGKYSVIPATVEDKAKIEEAFDSRQIAFFTHSEPSARPFVAILKNFCPMEPENVKKLLTDLEIPAESVSNISRSTMDPVYKVSFKKNTITYAELAHQHSRLANHIVRWEKFAPLKKRYIQCANCQRWGHGKSNCHMPRRCIKCREEHAAGECKRKTPTDEGEPHCVNCGQDGHPANATSCEVYKRHIASIEKRKRVAPAPPRQFTSTPARWANYNQNFPAFPTNPSQSISHAQPQAVAAESSREYRPPSTQTQSNRSQAQNVDNFSQMFNLGEEIMAIPGMDETLRQYHQLLAELRAAHPLKRLPILQKYGLFVLPFQP